MLTSPPSNMSWRERRRSRLAEVMDGGAMMFSDVAVVRAVGAAAVMLVLAFVARNRSTWAWALVIAAFAFLFAEMLNTLVEMLVDRISLEANVFSARIKHASAFFSACTAVVAICVTVVVSYHALFKPPEEEHSTNTPQTASGPAATPPASPPRYAADQPSTPPTATATTAATSSSSSGPCSVTQAEGDTQPTADRVPTVLQPFDWRRSSVLPSSAGQRLFASSHVRHPFSWDARRLKKKRYRRRR
jgi:diacylglycerol kinase